jgi:23S rRNA pseudouridine2605 synthase
MSNSIPAPPPERLQKVLARAGLGSRRTIEAWIAAGRIYINDHVATLGECVSSTDEIRLDGRKLALRALSEPERKILCYHKQIGEVSTRSDPEGRPTVFDNLPVLKHGRWIAIGRLDANTAGLLLFTTDGELAYRLMHPQYEMEREYAVRVLGEVSETALKNVLTGVELEDGVARFKQVVEAGGAGANHWYHVVITEGRKREVRRLWESQNVVVSRLMRIRFGPVLMPRGLRAGQHLELDDATTQLLLQQVGLVEPPPLKKMLSKSKRSAPKTDLPKVAATPVKTPRVEIRKVRMPRVKTEIMKKPEITRVRKRPKQ